MNILHVVNIPFVIPYFLGNQIKWFTKRGYKEYIVCSASEELKIFSEQYEYDYKAIEIVRRISIVKDIKALFSTINYIKEIRADVVVGHTPKGGMIAMLAGFFMQIPIRIYFRHGLVYETSQGIKRYLLMSIDRLSSKLATKIVCVSPSVGKKSIEDRLNKPSKQIVLGNGTCNGIDVNRFCKKNIDMERLEALRTKLGIREDDFVVGFVGRLVKDKGIIDLVKAYQMLKNKYSNAKLLLVGMLEKRDALPADIVSEIKNECGIIETGYVGYSEIEYYYALMHVFVLISYREGFPTSVLEASSMGLPVMTTKATGCIDSIVEGETGFFVDHDYKKILSGLDYFYNHEEERNKMGSKGREFVVNHFDQHLIWTEIQKIYK